jgi:hypothetical protein
VGTGGTPATSYPAASTTGLSFGHGPQFYEGSIDGSDHTSVGFRTDDSESVYATDDITDESEGDVTCTINNCRYLTRAQQMTPPHWNSPWQSLL